MRNPYELEQIIKGFDHNKRITVLYTIGKLPDKTVAELSEIIEASFGNTSAHIEKMH